MRFFSPAQIKKTGFRSGFPNKSVGRARLDTGMPLATYGSRLSGIGLRGMMTVVAKRTAVMLVVEDDREMRSLLCDEFWSAGYQLREAKDGDEAFLAVLQSVPDLILTDLRMPAGGADYISRLRTVAPNCPIVVMTAFGDSALKASVLRAGANAYFDKPVRIADLKACVERLLTDRLGVRPGGM
jgi:CheY-like chemotaxis protein